MDGCVCVLLLCVSVQLAYPGSGNGLPLGASPPRVTLGPASLQLMGQLYSTTSVEYPCQHSLQVLRGSYGRALGAGEDPRICYRPAPGFAPKIPGAFAAITTHMARPTYLTASHVEQHLWLLGEERNSTLPSEMRNALGGACASAMGALEWHPLVMDLAASTCLVPIIDEQGILGNLQA